MTVEEFRKLFPSLTREFVDEQIEGNLHLANMLIRHIVVSKELKYEAEKLLAAHLLALDRQIGGNGNSVKQATSKRIGDVQYSYASSTGDRSWYAMTGYGQKLLMLIELTPKFSGAFVV